MSVSRRLVTVVVAAGLLALACTLARAWPKDAPPFDGGTGGRAW